MRVNVLDGGGPDTVWVDRVSEFFGRLEEGNSLCGDIYFFPCFWIAAHSGISLAGSEASEAPDFNFVAGLECADNGIEESVNDNFAVASG